MDLAVAVARRKWYTAKDVLNSCTRKEIGAFKIRKPGSWSMQSVSPALSMTCVCTAIRYAIHTGKIGKKGWHFHSRISACHFVVRRFTMRYFVSFRSQPRVVTKKNWSVLRLSCELCLVSFAIEVDWSKIQYQLKRSTKSISLSRRPVSKFLYKIQVPKENHQNPVSVNFFFPSCENPLLIQ